MLLNDSELSKKCEIEILANPSKRHMEMFPRDGFITSLNNIFERSDIKYAFANNEFYGEAGAQQIGPIQYNMWVAFNDSFAGNALFMVESCYLAMEYFEENIPKSIGFARVSEKYTESVRFAKHLGFEVVEFDGNIFTLRKMFWGI